MVYCASDIDKFVWSLKYNMKRLFVLLIILAAIGLSSCADNRGIERFRGQSAEHIFTEGEKYLAKDDWEEAIDRFQAIQAFYPYSNYAQETQLSLMYAYYMDEDYDSVESAVDRYTHLYPLGPHTDYALYMKGLAEYQRNWGFFEKYFAIDRTPRDLHSEDDAFSNFTLLLIRFPNSPYASDARMRMVGIRNMIASNNLQIANYYYSLKAYVAAAQRASIVALNFQQSPSAVDALVLMAQCYKKLALSAEYGRTKAVIAANYPDRLSDI